MTREQRSRVMSRNKSKGTKSTERALRMRMVSAGLRGWRIHPPGIFGRPDFAFPGERLVIFVDGCFWHGCGEHRSIPASNREFWNKKITRNIERDAEVTERLVSEGWTVLRFWEHDIRTRPQYVIDTIAAKLADR